MKFTKNMKKAMSEEKVKQFIDGAGDRYHNECNTTADNIRADWDKKGIIYDEKYIKKSKHPDKMCGFCDQKGCDIFVKKYSSYFHKKCFRYVIKKSVMTAPKILGKTVFGKQEQIDTKENKK
jgi:hypothetical protein